MEKYDILPRQLLHEGTLSESNFFVPGFIDRQLAESVHDTAYLDRLYELELTPREQRISGFPHSHQLIERESMIMEGTRKAAEWAMEKGAAMNIAGGTHHAFTNRGEGFCLMNDQAIAASYLLEEKMVKKILIVDLDVHQGNGTAEIFEKNDQVFTFSMHGKNNYPLKKERSNLDVELADQTNDKEYHHVLESSLDEILNQFIPDFVFYQAGVDVLASDQLGKLALTIDGAKKRDEIIFNRIRQLAVPVVCTMGGGYSKDLRLIIEAHANTFRTIQHILF
jgi:acetoin utilization deacetylase AcuC-like enzyme